MTTFGFPRWARIVVAAFLTLLTFVVIFRLGSQASAGVTLSDPVVWVEDGARGRILQINGSTREITATVEVTENNGALLSVLPNGRDAVFLNRSGGMFAEIGAVDLEPVNEVDTGLSAAALEPARFLGAVDSETGQHQSYVVSDQGVSIFSDGASEPVQIPVSNGLGAIVTAPTGQLVAVSTDGDQLLISGTDGLVALADLPGPSATSASAVELVRAGDSVFTVDASRRTVQEVDLATGEFGDATSICGSIANGQIAGNTLTTSDGRRLVLVHDAPGGSLTVTDPDAGRCEEISLTESGDNFGPPVAVDAVAYLPNYETGQVVVVDLDDRVVVRTYAFTPVRGRAFELEVFDGAVWANEPSGVRVAVVSPDEIVPISKQERVRVLGVGEDGEEAIGGGGVDDADGQRVFGEGGDLFEGFARDSGTPFAGDDEIAPIGGDDSVPGTEGGEVPIDGELLSGNVAELLTAPLIVEPADVATPDEVLDEVLEEVLAANFEFSADVVLAGEQVRLIDVSAGNPNQWIWDFGDGTGDQGPDVTKTWEVEGLYTVTMSILNAAGQEAVQAHDFTVVAQDVLLPPGADFTFDSDTIEVGESLEFVNTSTGDPETLFWTLGDGTTDVGSVITKTYTEPGVYEVTLTATNPQGSDSQSTLITVVPGGTPPQAIIGTIPTTVGTGESVTLTSESTNSPTSTLWNFGDGTTGSGTVVRHAWDEPGEYQIRLAVENAAGEDAAVRTIFVEAAIDPPIARFTQDSLEVIAGEFLQFADQSLNSPSSLLWEFGDGSTGQGANVTKTWDVPGTYTVTLTVTNEAGEDNIAKTVTVLPVPVDPPVASFQASAASVSVGELVRFTDTSTGDPTEWSWNFDDGPPAADSSAENPVHAFTTPGTYEVELTATNEGGFTTFSQTIVVADPPIASFTRTIDELTVAFEDESVNDPNEWLWRFGDGTTSTAQSPSKTYDEAGTYRVTLVATNDAGSSTEFARSITVAERPVADFDFEINGFTVAFDDETANGPTTWSWDFGDGVTVANPAQNPVYTFEQAGVYRVTLTASNEAGSSQETRRIVVRTAPPVADFTCSVSGSGATCDGSDSSSAATFAWSAPGATSATQVGGANAGTAFPTFTFPSTGTYPITLTVTNSDGQIDTQTRTVNINLPAPVISFVNASSNVNGIVQFNAAASNTPTTWAWTLPAGATIQSGATTSSPTIVFSNSGQQTVSAIATNANGSSPPVFETVNIAFAPVLTVVNQREVTIGTVILSAQSQNNPHELDLERSRCAESDVDECCADV